MSYGIFFDKAFIKVDTDKVIPIIYHGSNNVIEVMTNKVAKDWNNYSHYSGSHNKFIISGNELMKRVDEYNDELKRNKEDYNPLYFGYEVGLSMYGKHTTKTTFSSYRGFIKNGIINAKTIEEYKKHHIDFHISVYCWDKQKDFIEKNIEYKPQTIIQSTEHLKSLIDEYCDYYNQFGYTVIISSNTSYEIFKMLKKKRNKTVNTLLVGDVYILKSNTIYGYLVKKLRNGFRYSFDNTKGKRFLNEKQAQKYIDKYKLDFTPEKEVFN